MSFDFLPGPTDQRLTLESVRQHRGRVVDFVAHVIDKIERASTNGTRSALGQFLLESASDTRMLRWAWDKLAARDGAPGPDGLRYTDFESEEVWERLRDISSRVLKDEYQPGPVRTLNIPKDRFDPSRGTRQIALVNIDDRVLQRAIVETLRPLLDPLFGNSVLGFRPRKGRFHALALAEQITVSRPTWYWLTEDLRDAFDNVPLGRLRDVLALHVPCQQLVELIIKLVGPSGTSGIQQGGPLSPLMLNLYLHHHLDMPWKQECPDVPLLRYADDLLLLCKTRKVADESWKRLHERLQPTGLQVKGTGAAAVTCRLTQNRSAEWLGFRISKVKQSLVIDVADKSWNRLSEHLMLCHERTNSPVRAMAAIESWIRQLGPCYATADRDNILAHISDTALAQGFNELPTPKSLQKIWKVAGQRWQELREASLAAPAGPSPLSEPILSVPTLVRAPNGDDTAPF